MAVFELLRDGRQRHAETLPGTAMRFEYADEGAGAKQIEQVGLGGPIEIEGQHRKRQAGDDGAADAKIFRKIVPRPEFRARPSVIPSERTAPAAPGEVRPDVVCRAQGARPPGG